MLIESIKLSPKKNGKGYVSSYSVNISTKEAQDCGLVGKRLIKIIDSDKAEIIVRAKKFTITEEILKELAYLKEQERAESKRIFMSYSSNGISLTMEEALREFEDFHIGKIEKPKHDKLEAFLMSLSVENIVDLVLMMYIGRDMDCKMNIAPGEERFLEFYERYDDLVSGRSKEELVYVIMEKEPLLMYLRTAHRLLNAPEGTPIDMFFHDWDEM